MYAWLNVVPVWRRYLQYARSTLTWRQFEPGPEHEAVEAVVLGLALPHARPSVLEGLADPAGVQVACGAMDEPEVVDPERGPVGRLDLVGPFVDDRHAHVLEQRQHVGQRDALTRAVELQAQVAFGHVRAGGRGSS